VKELLETISSLQTEYQSPVLAEEFIDGREFYVGVLGNSNAQALPIIELDFSKFPPGLPKIASWSAKWGEDGEGKGAEFAGTESVFPADLPEELSNRIRHVAVDAFHALRLRDYARVDLRVTGAEKIYVIEVNPNCYLEEKSEFAMAALREGMEYPALINRIVELASARYSR
jgi:D-alanine-D-alanine ligase